jgi:hypothetical protein
MNILLINPAPSETLKATGVLFPLSFIRMEWLFLKAHLLYYTRSKKAIQDIWHHIKKHHLGIGTLFHFVRDHFGG